MKDEVAVADSEQHGRVVARDGGGKAEKGRKNGRQPDRRQTDRPTDRPTDRNEETETKRRRTKAFPTCRKRNGKVWFGPDLQGGQTIGGRPVSKAGGTLLSALVVIFTMIIISPVIICIFIVMIYFLAFIFPYPVPTGM